MVREIKITEEKVKAAFAAAQSGNSVVEVLEALFDKPVVDYSDYHNIKTYEDACKATGIPMLDESQLSELGLTKQDIAYQKLAIIAKAINNGWQVNVCDSNVERWYPWFRPNGSASSFAFAYSYYVLSLAFAGSGSRLCFKSEELSDYCGNQFLDLWKEFIL